MAKTKAYYSLEEEFLAESDSVSRGFTFNEWLRIAEENKIERHLKVDSQFKVIEKFVKESPKLKPVPKNAPEPVITDDSEPEQKEELADIVSETLAKVYFDQYLFKKAIHVYEKLGLLYPENSDYFAAQIKIVKKKENEFKK